MKNVGIIVIYSSKPKAEPWVRVEHQSCKQIRTDFWLSNIFYNRKLDNSKHILYCPTCNTLKHHFIFCFRHTFSAEGMCVFYFCAIITVSKNLSYFISLHYTYQI